MSTICRSTCTEMEPLSKEIQHDSEIPLHLRRLALP